VLAAFLQIDDPADSGIPQSNRDHPHARRRGGRRRDTGRRRQALATEADLSDPATPASLFDVAEEQFGPVAILVNDATGGWHWAR
jgi:3-oxoacyl-[acyl-carrier protein] reductase